MSPHYLLMESEQLRSGVGRGHGAYGAAGGKEHRDGEHEHQETVIPHACEVFGATCSTERAMMNPENPMAASMRQDR